MYVSCILANVWLPVHWWGPVVQRKRGDTLWNSQPSPSTEGALKQDGRSSGTPMPVPPFLQLQWWLFPATAPPLACSQPMV